MASFAEYTTQTMATNDFTLFPFPEVWVNEQSFLPPSTYPEQTYINSTTFDSYPSQPAYSQAEQYSFALESSFLPKNNLQLRNADYSPSNSASHSFDHQNPPHLSGNSDSGASVRSALSSAIGSPSALPQQSHDCYQQLLPEILHTDGQTHDDFFGTTTFDLGSVLATDKGCVDPSLIQPTFSPTQYSGAQLPDLHTVHIPRNMSYTSAPSPQLSKSPLGSYQMTGKAPGSASPYMHTQSYQPYPTINGSRRQSISSVHSRHSQNSLSSEDSNKGLCQIPTCGRHVKDLKAHMLTHQNERPEKCPIPTCEYHIKGFARKYDKNRHTLTHYKGTMVCGFCPGSGSAAEKSFNRADVFKRHLTSVHGVEQTPPNARRKSPAAVNKRGYGRDVSGMCSTCSVTFASAQDFYEHLDDCVLRVVQQADPSEAINEKLLSSVAEDQQVQETMEKHLLPTNVDFNAPTSFGDEEEGDDEDEADEEDANDSTYGGRTGKSGKGSIKSRKTAAAAAAANSS